MAKTELGTPATLSRPALPTRRWGWQTYAKFAMSWVLVISVGRFIVPTSSHASPAIKDATAPIDLGPKIGTIIGPDYRVQINAGTSDPLYTVFSADGSTTLGRGLSAKQFAERFPTLDLSRLNATPEDASVESPTHADGHD